MPTSNYAGRFTRFVLPEQAVDSMPKPCRGAWDTYQTACDQLDEATRDAATAVAGLTTARQGDDEAALTAAAAGDAIPAATLPAAEAAYAGARRLVEARTKIAAQAEHSWLALAEEHRDVWEAAAAARVESGCRTAAADLDRLAPTLTDLAETEAVRRWLRRYPPHRLLASFPPGGPQPLGEALAATRQQVAALLPEWVDAEDAAAAAKSAAKAAQHARHGDVLPRGVPAVT